jgi:tetratricopeptide (TPR) repeat protein
MHSDSRGRVLHCCFDLSVRSIDRDFFPFLLLAEWHRQACEFDAINLIFAGPERVPNQEDGEPVMGSAIDRITRSGRLLLPSVKGWTVCRSRREAIRSLHDAEQLSVSCELPRDLTTWDPKRPAEFLDLFAELDVLDTGVHRVPSFSPTQQARDYVESWTAKVARGRHVVTISPPSDCVDLGAWKYAIEYLSRDSYCPVVFFDNPRAELSDVLAAEGLEVFPGTEHCPSIRVHLYRSALLNLVENDEGMAICAVDPCINFWAFGCQFLGILQEGPTRRLLDADNDLEKFCDASLVPTTLGIGRQSQDSAVNPSLSETMSINAWFEKALAFHASGARGMDRAITIYRSILNKESDHSGANGMLGVCALTFGRIDEAIQLLGKATTIEPDEPAYRFYLGVSFWQKQDRGNAILAFKEAVVLDPDILEAWEYLALIYREAGQEDLALSCFARVVADGHCTIQMIYDYADCLERCNQTDLAADFYEIASKRYFERLVEEDYLNSMISPIRRRPYLVRNAWFSI